MFWEIWSKKMAEDAESDIAIRFVDENDEREVSVSAKRKLKKNRPFSCIELTVQQGNP